VITGSLLRLNDRGIELGLNSINQDLYTTLEQLIRLLEQVENASPQTLSRYGNPAQPDLADHFVTSVKKAAKRGMKAT